MDNIRPTSAPPEMHRKPRQYRPVFRKPDHPGARLAWLGILDFVLVALARIPYLDDGYREPANSPAITADEYLPEAEACAREAAGRVAVETKPATGDPAHVSG